MDPVTVAALIGIALSLVLVAVGASLAWWMLRKTLTMLKRLVIVGVTLGLLVIAVGAAIAVVLL